MLLWLQNVLSKQKDPNMWLFAGLGNPGDKYARNRHNIGFAALETIADEYGFSSFKSKFQGELSEGRIGGQKVALLKPQTFMNESGQSVGKAAKFYKIDPKRIVVFHDELDLDPGKVKVRLGGGLAGHNGLKSIKAHLSTPDFVRVRMGIGHPGDKNRVSGYVLSDFSKVDQNWLEPVLEATARNAPLLLEDKNNDFMTQLAEAVR